jgi:hypothetical protein
MRKYVPAPIKRVIRQWVPRGRRRLFRQRRVGEATKKYGYVFIVTYGRSGSTLLMSLLNTIPGYRILGENYNALYHLYRAGTAIRSGREKWSGPSHLRPQSGWYGAPETRPAAFERELLDSFVAHVLRPRPGDRVLGFKEVRYTGAHVPDLFEYLAFLRRAFPGCKIVFNHRDPAAVARSGWWTRADKGEERVRAADRRLWSIPADEQHFHVVYERIDDTLEHIRELFAFLGEPMDEPAVRAVLRTRHSPPPKGTVPAQKASLDASARADRIVEAD